MPTAAIWSIGIFGLALAACFVAMVHFDAGRLGVGLGWLGVGAGLVAASVALALAVVLTVD